MVCTINTNSYSLKNKKAVAARINPIINDELIISFLSLDAAVLLDSLDFYNICEIQTPNLY